MIFSALKRVGAHFSQRRKNSSRTDVNRMFSKYSMVSEGEYIRNLKLSEKIESVPGAIVECGVWRGGMIGGIARILGRDRTYLLLDSFEGLPPAQEIDGPAAIEWQADKTSPRYRDNCRAEIEFARQAMTIALDGDLSRVKFIQGWFSDTLPHIKIDERIALLRLDGDWYESTLDCLEYLFPLVQKDGLIIIDDYHTWDGCSKAVHDYLSKYKRCERVSQFENRTAYIIKK